MKNATSFLEIKNFKTIKHQRIDCSRVNVFIGEPNVGKSNILEALAMLRIPNNSTDYHESDFKKIIRCSSPLDLFHKLNGKEEIKINTSINSVSLKENSNSFFEYNVSNGITHLKASINSDFDWQTVTYDSITESLKTFKYYNYSNSVNFSSQFSNYLSIPDGSNLHIIIKNNPELFSFFKELFKERYNLDFSFDKKTKQFEVLQSEDSENSHFPYSMIADTLQRLIFYYAAIESNKDSVLIFEEPEVHSFPPYISMLGDKIARDKDNQYFITTHSPYMLNTIIENTESSDCNVFVVDYQNHETIIHKVSEEGKQEILSDGDLSFFNLQNYIQ